MLSSTASTRKCFATRKVYSLHCRTRPSSRSSSRTREQPLSPDAKTPLDVLLGEMNSPSEVMTLRILNQGELHNIVASGAAGELVNMEVMLHQWGMLQSPYLAYYGQVAVADVAISAELGTPLTAKNLRQFKGLTEVNESITKTLISGADRFWYFNNGITILCESLRKKPLGEEQRNRHF